MVFKCSTLSSDLKDLSVIPARGLLRKGGRGEGGMLKFRFDRRITVAKHYLTNYSNICD